MMQIEDLLREINTRLTRPGLDAREKRALANLLASTLEMFDAFLAEHRNGRR